MVYEYNLNMQLPRRKLIFYFYSPKNQYSLILRKYIEQCSEKYKLDVYSINADLFAYLFIEIKEKKEVEVPIPGIMVKNKFKTLKLIESLEDIDNTFTWSP